MRRMRKQKPRREKKKFKKMPGQTKCRFCRARVKSIDYKDVASLEKLCSSQGKIFSRKRSGNCATHQRASKWAIKRARFLALLPYVG